MDIPRRPGAPPPVCDDDVKFFMAFARAARGLEFYEDLVSTMESVARMRRYQEMRLTAEEKMLVEIGYRKVMEAKRQERKRLELIKQEDGNNSVDDLIHEVEREMEKICREARFIINDQYLLPPSTSALEELVYYYTMIGDFYRYRSESKTKNWGFYASVAFKEYEKAERIALRELTGYNLVRLRLSYSFSTLCYMILPISHRALGILIIALDAALLSPTLLFLDEAGLKIVELLIARLHTWFPPNRVRYIGGTPPPALALNADQLQILLI